VTFGTVTLIEAFGLATIACNFLSLLFGAGVALQVSASVLKLDNKTTAAVEILVDNQNSFPNFLILDFQVPKTAFVDLASQHEFFKNLHIPRPGFTELVATVRPILTACGQLPVITTAFLTVLVEDEPVAPPVKDPPILIDGIPI